MNTKEEVVVFLEGLKTYLYGDLALFEKLCSDAEDEERKRITEKEQKSETQKETIIGSFSDIVESPVNYTSSESPITTSSTTIQTTQPPGLTFSQFKDLNIYRSTIPHILTILGTNDLVGYLLGDWELRPTPTKRNMKKFFSHLTKPSETDIDYLTFFYRHGMAHTYFPKKKLGIKAHITNPKNELFFVENEIIILNANYLIELTKARLELILADTSLITNMKTQFQKLIDFDNSEMTRMRIDLETFKSSLPNIQSERIQFY
jgi:hypothetical protein